MSNAALKWAFNAPIKGAAKAVLIALADHADKDGQCYPSVARLAFMAGLCERATRNAIRQLEGQNLVATEAQDGHQSRYKLALEKAFDPGTKCPPAPRHDMLPHAQTTPAPHAGGGGTRCRGGGHEMPGTPARGAPEPLITLNNPHITPNGAPPIAPPIFATVRDELWAVGLPIIQGLTGKPDSAARAILGKLARDARDDCAALLAVLREAEAFRPVGEPVAWIVGAFRQRKNPDAALHRVLANASKDSEEFYRGLPH